MTWSRFDLVGGGYRCIHVPLMHTRNLDFGTVLKNRLRPPDQPIAQQGIHTRGYIEAR
jgi:hypothetical protein